MDLRIEKTYRALLAAFTDLLETHRYEDVTVAMLCDAAMIRRTTFYKHFADKAEFFSFFIDNLRINLLQHGEVQHASERSIPHRAQRGSARPMPAAAAQANGEFDARSNGAGIVILQGLVNFLLEHEALVDNIFKSQMTGMMMLVMCDKAAEAVMERYHGVFAPHQAGGVTLQAASEFAASGIVRLLQMWWTSGHSKEDERELITMANEMVARVMGA